MIRSWFAMILILVTALILPAGIESKEFGTRYGSTQGGSGDFYLPDQGLPTDQIIIKFLDPAIMADALALNPDQVMERLNQAAGVTLSYYRPMSGEASVLKLAEPLSLPEAEALSAALTVLPEVAYAEPDRILQNIGRPDFASIAANVTPNDTRFGEQWHYRYTAGTEEGLNLLPAWGITTGLSSTVVAVIDTGILNHADLAGRTVPGYDFISNATAANDGNGRDADPSDPGDWVTSDECYLSHPARNSTWHGTHVAGTIGAATDNSLGVAGVNWQAKILPVRVLGKCGGSTSDIVDGMRWSAGGTVPGVPTNSNPAQVLNLSLGGIGSCSYSEQAAIDEIVNAGATVVIAAGNNSQDASNFSPGNCDNIITVAANDRTGDKAWYSNFGSKVELSAPGGEGDTQANAVLSTSNTGTQNPGDDSYAYYQGTSMATPHVAGLASLIMGLRPDYTPAQVLARLQYTARPFPSGSGCIDLGCGSGIVDAYRALDGLINLTDQFYLPLIFQVEPVTPKVSFSSAEYQVNEAAGQAVIQATLSGPAANIVKVNYSTGGGSAKPGDDYISANGLLQFSPGQTSKSFSVTIIDNALFESKKTIGLSLSNPEGAELGATAQATLTINNDDDPPSSIINGDFEQGATGWNQSSTHGWTLILDDRDLNSFPDGIKPRSGNWAVWLGGDFDDISYIEQQVVVSVGSPYLSYYHWIASADGDCGYDFAGVMVNNSTIADIYDLCDDNNSHGWVKHVADLSSWIGQTITFQIWVATDGYYNSNLFVDDVSFESSASVEEAVSDIFRGVETGTLILRRDLMAHEI